MINLVITNKANCIYFILFHFIVAYIAAILLGSVITRYFKQANERAAIRCYRRIRNALLAAFRILDYEKKGLVLKRDWLGLYHTLKPENSLEVAGQVYDVVLASHHITENVLPIGVNLKEFFIICDLTFLSLPLKTKKNIIFKLLKKVTLLFAKRKVPKCYNSKFCIFCSDLLDNK